MASANQLEAVLREIIAAERTEATSELAGGGPENYAAYREQVGFIRALDLCSVWFSEAAIKLDER